MPNGQISDEELVTILAPIPNLANVVTIIHTIVRNAYALGYAEGQDDLRTEAQAIIDVPENP